MKSLRGAQVAKAAAFFSLFFCTAWTAQAAGLDELARARENDFEGNMELQGETDFHANLAWLIGASGLYTNGINGEPVWNTNVARFWRGIWKEDANGWRVELNFERTNTPDVSVWVSIGSVVRNTEDGTGDYFLPPRGRFAKFELLSPDGTVIRPQTGDWSMERDWPKRMPVRLYLPMEVGPLAGEFWFVSNGPPFRVGGYSLEGLYSITNEGDYTLTVRPFLYHNLTGRKIDVSGAHFHQTNTDYFDRVDLPAVSCKIHLIPEEKYHPPVEQFWRGAWVEDTNGWRVQLVFTKDSGGRLAVQWGSVVKNSRDGYLRTPNGKFAKFELLDFKGNIVPLKPTAGTNLLAGIYGQLIYPTNLPAWAAPSGGSLEADFPKIISTNVYPRFPGKFSDRTVAGDILESRLLPPENINVLILDDLYSITNEGDYTLTVCPVLYKQYNHADSAILDRVDLPCVTTKIHLIPNVK